MRLYGRARAYEENEVGAINVSPLIDVVFILLIFFIVSATFVSLPGIEVSRPKTQTAESLEKNSILFALSQENRIFHAGEEIGLKQIPSLIELASKDRKKPVVIQSDEWADAALLAKSSWKQDAKLHPFPLQRENPNETVAKKFAHGRS